VKQSENDNVYNVDGINIIVQNEVEKSLKGAKINYGGLLFKDFLITPRF
jgi:Fe-S cluster assembly iron-binding protein IscA